MSEEIFARGALTLVATSLMVMKKKLAPHLRALMGSRQVAGEYGLLHIYGKINIINIIYIQNEN